MMTKTLALGGLAVAFALMIPLASAATPLCVPSKPIPVFECAPDPVFDVVCQPVANLLNEVGQDLNRNPVCVPIP